MRGITRYLLLFLLFFGCRGDREVLDTGELVLEFENLWWEAPDEPTFEHLGGVLCFNFNTSMYEDEPIDGKLIYFIEGDSFSYPVSDFERTDDGYYLPGYDIEAKVFVDDDGNYSIKVKSGILSKSVDIIPCSLGQ